MSRRVHLVRHGEVHNPRGVIYGSLPGFGLSERGRAQASHAARQLGSLVRGPITLVASPLQRAQETAQILCDALSPYAIRADENLREAESPFDGLVRRGASLAYLGRLLDADARKQYEGTRAVGDRMRSAIEHAMSDEAELVVVSHQLPIRMACVAFQRGVRIAPWRFGWRRCEPASITTLDLEETRVVSIAYWEPT